MRSGAVTTEPSSLKVCDHESGSGTFGERRGCGDGFVIDVAVEYAHLNDRHGVGDSNRDGSGETLLSEFVGHHQRNGVNAGRGEGVRHLWTVSKRTVGEGPVPNGNVG